MTTARYDRSTPRSKRRSRNWILEIASYLLFVGLLAALVYVAWINIAPYVQLVENLGIGATQNWLLKVPLIGGLVAGWSNFLQAAVGFLIWCVVQIFQCLGLLIRLDKDAMTGAIKQSHLVKRQLPDLESDDDATADIKASTRKIPYLFIRWSGYLALAAYTFDAIVGFSLYPPARSIGEFLTALSLGAWSQIDLDNLVKLLVMLFAFEALLALVIIAWQWLSARTTWNHEEE